ncbi:PP0621 family protein, partial [Thiolapillus sp.]
SINLLIHPDKYSMSCRLQRLLPSHVGKMRVLTFWNHGFRLAYMKIIFLLASAGLIWWIVRTLRNSRPSTSKPKIKNMVSCDYCGLHVPEDECIRQNGHNYCSREHAQKDSG